MKTGDIILGIAGLGVLYWAYTKMNGASSGYVPSQAVMDKIYADPNVLAWKVPDPTPDSTHPAGEWDSLCGTWSNVFPSCCSSPTDWSKVNMNTILSWFKGMNVNPVHDQGYALDPIVVSEITRFFTTAKQNNYMQVPTGAFVKGTKLDLSVFTNSTNSNNSGVHGWYQPVRRYL